MNPIYRSFALNFFNFEIIFTLSVFKCFIASKVFRWVLPSLFIVTYHSKKLMTESEMSQFLILFLVICGHGLPMVLDGFIPIFSSAFHPKSTLILFPIFQLPKGKSQSPCPHISMEALVWLASAMILSPNCALPIAISFDPTVVADNERC